MKKHFLKSFALLAMLFSTLTMSAATQYCDVLLEADDGDVKYSLYHVSGNTYGIQVVPQDGMALTGIANPNIGVNQSAGAGITIVKDLWTISNNVATAIFQTASETSVPTNFFTAYICFNKTGGKTGRDLVEVTIPASDIDWTATCGLSSSEGEGGEDTDTETPVLESVELFGAAQKFVLLTPTATDDKGVTSYLIAQSGDEESEVTPDATTGQIKIESLTLGTTYTYTVKAKDADGNVSNAKEITFSTLDNVFCEEEVLPGTTQEFANQKLTFTAKKVSDTETYFAITSSTSTLTKISTVTFYNNTGETGTYGGGVLPEGYVLKDGWTLTDNTLSKTVTWTTYPTAPFRVSINASREKNSTDEKALINVLYTMDLSNTCGEAPVEPTPESIIESTYFAPGWQPETNSTATYDAETGAITVDLKSQFNSQWQAQVKVKHDVAFSADKQYTLSCKFHATAAVGGVTIKMDDNQNPAVVYENASVNLPANEDYVYTSAPSNGKAGNNQVLVFDFGWAQPCQITIKDIVIQEVESTTPDEPAEPEVVESNYCQTPLTSGTNTIYLTCEKVSDGNYRMTVEGENLTGFGGSFYNPGEKDLRDAITSQTSTKIVCDIAAESAPVFYTPLYVNMPGEVNFGAINDIVWGQCSNTELQLPDLAIVSPSNSSHSLAVGETFTIGLSTSSTGAITYESSNNAVAEVSANGVITAKAIGSTTITISQAADATYQAGSKTFTLEVVAVPVPSNKGFGTYQGRVDLYDWIGDYAGNNACGQVDLYVVTWGNDILYKAKVVDNKFEDGTDWKCQLRTRNADLSDNPRESWGKAIADDGATRYSEYGNTYENHSGLVGYGETFKMWSYMVIAGCGARTMKTLTYTRDHINNPIADNTAPTLSGAANVTSTAENVTIALPAVTSEEVFYMIKDEAHNKQYISITPSFVLPKDGSGITYTYSCYAVDFNGNMSAPLTAEVSMPFNATSNLALNKSCQAGYSTNNDRLASKANDGDLTTRWSSEQGNNPTDAWWYVDLGESYNLSTIEISWEGACATDYVIMGSDEYIDPTNATAWQTATTLVAKTTAPTVGNNTQEVYPVTGQHARYLRLQANTLANNDWGCSFYEFRVFGTGVYDPNAAADTEKPVITSATPKTPIAHNEVQITMVASDNVGVVSYEVKDDAKGVSVICVPVDNVITVSNLQEQTTYNLSIVAVDAVGNKSDVYAMAAFTTGVNPYVPHEAAPTPTRDAEDVVSFYSNAYTPAIDLWGKNQWGGVNFLENNIAGDNYLHYAGNITNLGWEYNVNAGYTDGEHIGVNCSEMEYMHIDIWGYAAGTIRVIPIYGGTGLTHNEGYYTDVEILAGQWNSVDIALADFEGNAHDFSSIYQFKYTNCNNTIAIDNVYFWKSAGTLPVESVTLDKTTATIEVDEALQLKATVLPTDAANKNVVWTSSDATVATVVDGLVTGLKEGTTTITATSEYDNTKLATCVITVEPITEKTWWGEPTTITVEGQEIAVLYCFTRNVDKTITYTAIFGTDKAFVKEINVESLSTGFRGLTYDANTLTASWNKTDSQHNKGEVITGFWWFAAHRIEFTYIVGSSNERPNTAVTSVTLDKTSCDLLVDETTQLVATVNPGIAANKNVTWTSSNTTVATVDANGLVTAKSAGTAIITVTTADGGKTATCTINVVAALTDAIYHANAYFVENGRYVGVNYTITRTPERKLRYEVKVNAEVVGLVMQVNDDGVNYRTMSYDADTKSYTYTSEQTYTDGTTISGFFYPQFAGGANRWDFTNYVVGSTNTAPRTMVGVNDAEETQTARLAQYTSPVDVVVARSFSPDYWQTITLPFALNASQIAECFGTGTKVLKLAKAGVAPDQAMELGFTTVTAIQAATPYLILPAKTVGAGTVVRNVTLKTNAQTVKVSNVTMHPLLDKVAYDYTTDNVLFFVGSDNYLHYQANNNTILGLRAYFTFDGITTYAQAANVRARVVLNENEATGFDQVVAPEGNTIKAIVNGQLVIIRGGEMYNVQGQKL